ncbi:MAG: DUF1850 domain-containing protein, partial [Trueperaceae bacterium]
SRLPSAAARALGALLLLLLGPSALAASPGPEPYLVVRGPDGIVASIPLDQDPAWHLAWHHSVSGVLVRDFYAYRDGTMLLTHSHTPAYDAGLGHLPGRGRAESDGDGGYWIYDLNEPVPGGAYWLRVGSTEVAHTLVHASGEVNLSERAAGQRVRLEVELR